MKTIAIQQPWAWLIINAGKDIENRTWSTSYRGPLLIHASKKPVPDIAQLISELAGCGIDMPRTHEYHYGGIIGVVTLIDVVTRSYSGWFDGPYGFVLKHAKSLPFAATRGRLGLFDTPWPLHKTPEQMRINF